MENLKYDFLKFDNSRGVQDRPNDGRKCRNAAWTAKAAIFKIFQSGSGVKRVARVGIFPFGNSRKVGNIDVI